jgi:hypothetical protein
MTRISRDLTRKPIWMLSALFSLVMMGNVGCSLAGDQILPASLESRLSSSQGTADDHLAAARLYQQQAQQLNADAAKYARQAEQITPIEDPKGFRRSALKTAAQERQKQAHEMFQVVSEHQRYAETLSAKHSQQ